MSRFTRWLLGLALTLPVAAYVAGSLVASSAEPERDRSPVIVRDHEPGHGGVKDPTTPTATPPSDEDDPDDEDPDDVREVDAPPDRVGDDDDDDGEEHDYDDGPGDD